MTSIDTTTLASCFVSRKIDEQALVDRSHSEYWLEVAGRRLEKVECADDRHMKDMAKLQTGIDQVSQRPLLDYARTCVPVGAFLILH